jgi:hypothetical protein
LKNPGVVPILATMHLLLEGLGYLLAAVLIAHVVYFAGCLLVMAGAVICAPFVWLWNQLRA